MYTVVKGGARAPKAPPPPPRYATATLSFTVHCVRTVDHVGAHATQYFFFFFTMQQKYIQHKCSTQKKI